MIILTLALLGLLWLGHRILPLPSVSPPEAPLQPQDSTLNIQSGSVLASISSPLPQYETELWEMTQELNYDYDKIYNLWKCEDSELRHDGVFGDSGLAYGGFQWWDSSWYYYNYKFGLKLNRLLFQDQARLTIVVLKEKSENWRNWYNCLIKYHI